MGQPEHTQHDPWANLRGKKKPVTEELVSGDPWENMRDNPKPSYDEISKQVQGYNGKRTPQTIVYNPSTPKRMEDLPKRGPSNPWAGAPRSLWGKPKASLFTLLPYTVLRLGILSLIVANLIVGFLFVSTYWLQNVILFTYLGASTAVFIHYFTLMKYAHS